MKHSVAGVNMPSRCSGKNKGGRRHKHEESNVHVKLQRLHKEV